MSIPENDPQNYLVFPHLQIKLDDVFYGCKLSIGPKRGRADLMNRP